jgi:ADP-heptose:LPS heptosyltransferase
MIAIIRALGSGARVRMARRLIARADQAREDRWYQAAALLYEEALRLRPRNAAIHIQCGHMFKEAGHLDAAEAHYAAARRLAPEDPDLALQLGHFFKVAGRLEDSEAAYQRALALQPGWNEPLRELAALRRRGAPPPADKAWDDAPDLDGLVPELFPRGADMAPTPRADGVYIRRLGARRERSRWGMMPTLRGLEAIRGFCLSGEPVQELRILLQDQEIYRGAPETSEIGCPAGQAKYVFNVWFDFSAFAPGLRAVTVRFMGAAGELHRHGEHVVIAPALAEAAFPDSDGVVELAPGDARGPEAQIAARPSMIRPARRRVLPQPVRNVLVMRTDQLGDLITSIPAIRRLRALFPQARLVGLLTAANADMAATLPLFDDIIVVDFPDVEAERRRVMDARGQAALRARLAPYAFDIALDLAESAVSRPLLLLTGARFLYGFHHRDWPWLTGGFEAGTHDARNGLEIAAQSSKVLAFVERLGAYLASPADIIRRPDVSRGALSRYGIGAQDRYAVLHTGARIKFSQWPYYGELAGLILAGTALHVVLMTDDPALRDRLPAAVRKSGRFHLIDRHLPFDDFDALLSFCAVFVGNDSGPKHLAALRGVPVVSIHSARINWNEWGQELTGVIVSRKLPCAGCTIFHDAEECGKGFACVRDIRVEEVFGAFRKAGGDVPSPPDPPSRL